MEANKERKKPMDFVDLITPELPWEDLAVALGEKPDQSASSVTNRDTSLPVEQKFDAEDLSLFNEFANSLPSPPRRRTDSYTDLKATISSAVCVEEDADTGTDLAQDTETDLHDEDFGCLDEISLSSQLESIMAEILDGSVVPDCVERRASDNENEPVCRSDGSPEERSVLPGNDASKLNGAHSDVEPDASESVCNANSSYAEVDKTADEDAAMRQPGDVVSEVIGSDNEHRGVVGHGEGSDREQGITGADNGLQDGNDDHDITDSQQWLYDNLHGHLTQQHDEATRLNSLRVRLPQPPPGTASVPLDAVSRAIHAFTTEVDLVKLDLELTSALSADAPDLPRCCELLTGYSPYDLSPGVLVQYPLFAGTVDVCCRWDGDEADELGLHSAARRLRAFMMAMYMRHSVDEGFLTALNRQVAGHRRAMAANKTNLTKLMRKHHELKGLPEFYDGLYSDWDTFMSQFYEPDQQHPDLDTESQDSDDDGCMQPENQQGESSSSRSGRAADATDRSHFGAAVHSQHAVVCDRHRSRSECRNRNPVSEESGSADVKQLAGLPVKKRRVGRLEDSRSMVQLDHCSSGNGSSETGEDRRRRTDVGDVTSVDCEVKHGDVTAKRRRGCPRKYDDRRRDGHNEDEDIKPVLGTIQICRKIPTQSGSATETGRKNRVEVDGQIALASFEEQDVKPDLSSLGVAPPVEPVIGTIQKRRRRKIPNQSGSGAETGRKNGVEVDGQIALAGFEEQDVKPDLSSLGVAPPVEPVLGTIVRRRRRKIPNQMGSGAESGRKNGVEVDGQMALTGFEEQDVKPDLSSLGVAPPVDSELISAGVGVTVRRRSGRLRKSGDSGVVEDIKPDIGTLERNREKGGKPKQSGMGLKTGGRKNGVEVDVGMACSGSEATDLASLDVVPGDAAMKTPSGHLRTFGVTSVDGEMKQVVGTIYQRTGKGRRSKQPRLGRKRRKVVKAGGETACVKSEELHVKPDLNSLVTKLRRHRHRRPWRLWLGSPGVCTRNMYRARQLRQSTAMNPTRVSPARSCKSPPFKLLSPSQIKVEVES